MTTGRMRDISRRAEYIRGFGVLLFIAVLGLLYVKWGPYFHKSFVAASDHNLGPSIVTGGAASPPSASLSASIEYSVAYFAAIWKALVLALLLAATVETLVPRDWLARVLGSRSFRASALGGALSLPGMMCTCCTAPIVKGLRKTGVSIGGGVAFFLGNPTLNPAVMVFLIFTLGWKWAALRLALGVVLVLGSAALATRLTSGPAAGLMVDAESVVTPDPEAQRGNVFARWLRSLWRLVIGLLPEYIVIVLALGAARVYLFPSAGPELGNGIFIIAALAVAGTLFVIPTAGEIPIIQTMMSFGLGLGPAGVLLMTLAPVSLPSLVMVGRSFPKRVLAAIFGLTVLVGIAGGLLAIPLL